ncbi:MAG TPA: SDR family oxidoreductase [Anaerolineaceae bacterium]
MKIESKIFVVTGAGNGIGRELVLALLKKGARVAGVDISESGLQQTTELAGSLKDRLSTHALNISDRAAVEALPAAVIAAHGAVDGLVNCAGVIQKFVRFNDLAYSEIERMMNVNFYGTVYMTKAFLPTLLARPEAHVVNVSSMGAFLPVPGQTMYGASKAAIKLFTEGLYSELLDTKVRVTVVFPGAIATNIAANSGVTIQAAGSGQEQRGMKTTPAPVAAETILRGMENNSFQVMVGSDSKFMSLISRLAPKQATEYIYKKMGSLLKN